ncbi:MAG: hypothetical protein ABL886_12785, partial [Rhodoglobus sp.]
MIVKSKKNVLHLFSSDYREQYVQDVFDAMAMPGGVVQRFRYRQKWVSLGAGSQPTDWTALAGSNTDVIVYFVAAKSDYYSETVYVPMRTGKVVGTFVEGDYYFVDFALDAYIDVTRFKPNPEFVWGSEGVKTELARLTSAIRSALSGEYPVGRYGQPAVKSGGKSAVLGQAPFDAGSADGDSSGSAFTNTVNIIGPCVPRLDSSNLDGRVFLRVVGVR